MKTVTIEPSDHDISPPTLPPIPLHRRLMFRVPAIVTFSVSIILALVLVLMEFAVKPRLRDLADKSAAQSSALIGQELRKRVTIAGTLCQTLARAGEVLPLDADQHMTMLPRLINGVGDGWFVAGGGIWPEPGQFSPGIERRCFFFGREPDGRLKYYDDYNSPSGAGYHHEEWYVPVRFVDPQRVYWSRSYVDPYSHEPMVTCSAPMYRDGRYYGVATVDVKLSGLRELFRRSTSQIGGYAFAVDREGVFLTFPDDSLIRTIRKDSTGTNIDSFLSTNELARSHPEFASIASTLDAMDADAIKRASSHGHFDAETVAQIDAASYQIDARQARLIVGFLSTITDPSEQRRINVGDDVQLAEGCIVTARRMPDTGWKIITVMPESRVFADSRRLYRMLMLSLGGMTIVGLGGTLLVLYRDIVRPITRMTSDLRGDEGGRRTRLLDIPDQGRSELGLLASTINAYSRSRAEAIDALARSRDDLEARVLDRTRELQEINVALDHSRREADAANRTKSEFLANMSHEIRTPLTAILGFADLLRDDLSVSVDPAQRLQAIATINCAGSHLLAIINDILDLSKIEAGRMTVECIDTPLTGVLREIESLVRPRATEKGVRLAITLDTPIPDRITSDPTRLRQILTNLVGNAVKFTEHGAVDIIVSLRHPNDAPRLIIDVHDTGPGMTPEQCSRVFTAFGQADGTVTRKHGGTGLGLTISSRLAELMGGAVTLVRTEVGKGSCFRIDLPAPPADGSTSVQSLEPVHSPPPSSNSPASQTLHGRILLAEDGVDNQRLIAFFLRKAGASVDIAPNGRIALEMHRRALDDAAPYALLLTDMQMPEMDGYTLAQTLRRQGSTIPIIALTANAMAEDRVRCLRAGCDDYATKPIDKLALISTCHAWITTRRPGTAAA